tara:strand:- start:126 stop:1040 length:915 start_codon:yes stop_codon:yes gene_type:complete
VGKVDALIVSMKDIESCLVCGADVFHTRYESTFSGTWEDAVPLFLTERIRAVHGRVLDCKACGFVFTSPQFDPDEYASIYESVAQGTKSIAVSPAEKARFDDLARRVRRYVPPGRFLDLGCGKGNFHHGLKDDDGCGFEISAHDELAFDDARHIYTGNFSGFAGNALHSNSFDFVTAWDVLEHLAEPSEVMEGIAKILRPDGLFFCTLPNISSVAARLSGGTWNCLLLEHLWYFDPKTLNQYLARYGFEQLEISGLWFPADVGTIANRLAQTYGWSAFRLPKLIERRVFSLPIGQMFAAYRWNG